VQYGRLLNAVPGRDESVKVRVSSSDVDVLVWRRVFTVGLCKCWLGSRDWQQARTLGLSPVHATLARALQVPFRLCSSLLWLRRD
jgi:hypothetical protein